MPDSEVNVITGAFSYTGKYITRRLLAMGKQIRTLTGHPNNPNPFGNQVSVHPFNFDKPEELVKSLQGAPVKLRPRISDMQFCYPRAFNT